MNLDRRTLIARSASLAAAMALKPLAASAALTGTTGTTLARTAWATLARATGTGAAGCGLVALLFTEKLLNLFAAGPFLVVNFSVAVFIEIFEE